MIQSVILTLYLDHLNPGANLYQQNINNAQSTQE